MERRTKPHGGFRFIEAFELLWIYSAFNAGQIRWYDLRVWFACQEALATRCRAKKGVPRRYREEEIQRLIGAFQVADVQSSLRRLKSAGLLRWSSSGIVFANGPHETRTDDSNFSIMAEDLGQPNRKVPVPRQAIRLIASGARKVLTATILGHVLRCCYVRRGEYSCEGSCSASWIARLFGLNERNVKTARKHLLDIDLLLPGKADAWHRQRYGGRAIVNPNWSRTAKNNRSPRNASFSPKRSPLLILKGNSFGSRNQKPSLQAGPRIGVCSRRKDCLKTPTWNHVEFDDLRHPKRTLALFEEAASRGLVSRSEAGRLSVMTAAVHALRVGETNPCGLFVSVITRRLWHHLTIDEEDAARRRIHQLAERGEAGFLVSRNERQMEDDAALPWRGPCETERENSAERLEVRKLVQQSLASTEALHNTQADSVFTERSRGARCDLDVGHPGQVDSFSLRRTQVTTSRYSGLTGRM